MGTLVCTVEMDKNGGVTVKIDNADGKITQTITMDGTTVQIKVAGESATSTITQDAEKIAIACKVFELTAEETITVKSGKASAWTSDDTFSAKSSKAMSLESTADVSVDGQKIVVTGKTEVDLAGAQSKLALAAAGATLSTPAKLALEAQGQAAMSGAMAEVKASGMLSLEASGVATLKGALTNVQGNLVNLG